MTFRTHVAVGVNAIWLTAFLGKVDATILFGLFAAFFGSILPDIDGGGSGAKIHYIGGGVLGGFRGAFYGKYFHHRGMMHSLFVSALMFPIAWAVLAIVKQSFFPGSSFSAALVALIFAVAYVSHPVIDGFNTGVGYLYPFKRQMYALVPKGLRTPVKGAADNLLFFVGAFGVAAFFILALGSLISKPLL